MGKWYILHVRTGKEETVKKLLASRSESLGKNISQVVVPTEEISEVKKGEKQIKEVRFWPGYMLVELDEDNDGELMWHMIKTTPGVLGFLGAAKNPVPLAEKEVEKILSEIEEKKSKPTPKIEFEVGDKVRITEGPFVSIDGVVEEVQQAREKLKVSVSIFGRLTLLEVNYWQVEKQ